MLLALSVLWGRRQGRGQAGTAHAMTLPLVLRPAEPAAPSQPQPQATVPASKDSASVQALLLGVAREPVLGELAGAASVAYSFPFLSVGPGLAAWRATVPRVALADFKTRCNKEGQGDLKCSLFCK